MFKVLSRLATPFTAADNAAPDLDLDPEPDLFPIVVSRSAVDVYRDNNAPLIAELIDYVSTLTLKGRFQRSEMPARAMQAFHIDTYLDQVQNGGHAQFIRHCGADLASTLEDIEAGLETADAAEQLMVLRRFIDWTLANPEEVARQTGFDATPVPDLAKLDRLFAAVEAKFPLKPKIAALVATAPELKIVSDLQLDEAREKLCDLNPDRGIRDRILSIAGLDAQVTDPFETTLSLAAGMVQPVAPIARIGNGVHREVDGTSRLCFTIETTSGKRWAVVHDDGIALHDMREHANPGMPDGSAQSNAPDVGARQSYVANSQAEPVSDLAQTLKIGAAIDLLLSRLIQPPRVDRITIQSAGPDSDGVPGMSLMMVLNSGTATMSAMVNENEAILLQEPDHKQITKAMRAEIDNYAGQYRLEDLPQ